MDERRAANYAALIVQLTARGRCTSLNGARRKAHSGRFIERSALCCKTLVDIYSIFTH